MNKKAICLLVTVLLCGSVFAAGGLDFDLEDVVNDMISETVDSVLDSMFDIDSDVISEGLHAFSEQTEKAVPNTMGLQGMWPDAYIGQILDLPPHFGGGVSAGTSVFDASGLQKALVNGMGIEMGSDLTSMVLPTIVADAKVGGLLIPFDVGLSAMQIAPTNFMGISVDLFTFSADLRIPIIKQTTLLPCISIGAGYAYSKGNIGLSVFDEAASIKTGYETQVMSATAQISKKLLFFTPFAGVRAAMTSSKNNWSWRYSKDDLITYANSFTGTSIALPGSVTQEDSYTDDTFSEFQFNSLQFFGGVGFDFLVIARINIIASYDFYNNIWAGGTSLRVQF